MSSKENEYAYAYGVVSGMTAKLVDDKTFDELARFRGVEEVLAFMEGTDYEHEIKKVVGKTIDIKDVENALKSHFIRVYEQIVSSIPDNDRAEFNKVMIEGFRAENLKIIMRGIHSGMEPEKIEELLETEKDAEMLKDLTQSKTLEEFAEKLEGTEYHDVLEKNMLKYNETGDLLPLENGVDKHLIESWGDMHSPDIRNFVGIRIDIINITTILRCKVSDVPVRDYIVEGGHLKDKLKDFEKAGIKDALEMLDKSPYGFAAREAMKEYEKTKSLVSLEGKLESEVMRYLKENAMLRPLGISSVMLFVNAKRREVKNLNTIVVCKHYDIPPEEIKEIMV